MNAIPLINNIPKTNINNEKQLRQEINTSLVALKKEAGTLEGLINEAAQMLVTINNRITTLENDTVKKSDIVDVVQSGNMNPVTSNAVATSNAMPIDTVTSGDMHSVTSNAVFKNKVKIESIFKTYNNCAPNTDVLITDYPLISDIPSATEIINFTAVSIRPLESWAQCPVQLYVNATHNGWVIRSLGSYNGSFEVQWDVFYI